LSFSCYSKPTQPDITPAAKHRVNRHILDESVIPLSNLTIRRDVRADSSRLSKRRLAGKEDQYRETVEEQMDKATVIRDIGDEQYSKPVRVIAFNTAEGLVARRHGRGCAGGLGRAVTLGSSRSTRRR
jgi:hypothetical protein